MSIPAGMMPGSAIPGQGGPPPGAGGPPPGGGGESPGPEEFLKLITQLQASPPQNGEDQLFQSASSAVGLLYSRIAGRSARAAKLVSECLPKLQAAREALSTEASRPMAGPPDLGAGMGFGGPSPTQPMPGMGM